MADKFKCPNCSSTRTNPLSLAIAGGTRRRRTVGFSRRCIWTSNSTYKSDFVSSLPERPSNGIAYVLIFFGICGLLFAMLISSDDKGAATVIGIIGVLLIVFGIGARKPAEQLTNAQAAWDKRWVCARCGHQWAA
jgi:hypothetical protein